MFYFSDGRNGICFLFRYSWLIWNLYFLLNFFFLDTSLGGVPLGVSGRGGVGEGLSCSVMSLLGSTLFLGVEWIGASGAGLGVGMVEVALF